MPAAAASGPDAQNELPNGKCAKCNCNATTVHILPCLHVLCSDSCLQAVIIATQLGGSRQPYCEKCSRRFAFNQLSTNIDLSKFLQKTLQRDDIIPQCNFCKQGGDAFSFCLDCKRKLCKRCSDYHTDMLDFGSHKLKMDLEEEKTAELEQERNRRQQCSLHSDLQGTFFCYNCQRMMCTECKSDHDINHVLGIVDEEMTNFGSTTSSIKETQDDITGAISRLSLKVESLQGAELNNFNTTVEEFFKRAQEMLQERERAILRAGEQATMVRVRDLQKIIADLKCCVTDATRLETIHHNVSAKMDKTGKLNFARISSALLESLKSVKRNLGTTFFESGVEFTETLLSEFEQIVKHLGAAELTNVPDSVVNFAEAILLSPAPSRDDRYDYMGDKEIPKPIPTLVSNPETGNKSHKKSSTSSSKRSESSNGRKSGRLTRAKQEPGFVPYATSRKNTNNLPSLVRHEDAIPHIIPGPSHNTFTIKNAQPAITAEIERNRQKKQKENGQFNQDDDLNRGERAFFIGEVP